MSTITTEPKSAATPAPAGAISGDTLAGYRRDFREEPRNRIAQNAVTTTTVDEVALDRVIVTSIDHTFSHKLDDWAATNQKKSGRCWMFAGLNLLRVGAMKKMNLKEFEFSQNWTLFWDKLERSNYWLEAIIETADRPVDDRTVAFLLDNPLEDGGQWNMFVNIINKYGLVPKSAMPETQSSSDTRRMNEVLLHKLREGAMTLRDLRASGAPMEAARSTKREILEVIHRILCIHLGTPPESFDWQWNDKDKGFHRDGMVTPRQFAEAYVTVPLDEYVCLVHDPRDTCPPERTYTVQHLGNIVGGDIVRYLNVEVDVMKKAAMDTISDGEPVWFGCDVGKMMRRDLGVWDRRLFDYETLYDTEFTLTKAQRLVYHQTLMTHAMLFTGVDIIDGGPRRWRVENSWGDDNGAKGFYVMNDSWFDEYVFEVAVHRDRLSPDLQAAAGLEPVVLPPWDPMGALA